MTRRRKLQLYTTFFIAIYAFFLILALSMRVLWVSIPLALLFGAGIAIPIYWKYRYGHSEKKEKKRMIAQKQINSHYYNRWYTPADSTELDYQIEQIKKRQKRLKTSI
jgi:hypothetical protein